MQYWYCVNGSDCVFLLSPLLYSTRQKYLHKNAVWPIKWWLAQYGNDSNFSIALYFIQKTTPGGGAKRP